MGSEGPEDLHHGKQSSMSENHNCPIEPDSTTLFANRESPSSSEDSYSRELHDNYDSRPDVAEPGQEPSSWENGIFTQGQVEGIPINFLVDTGAAVTVMSSAAYERIPPNRRPALRQTHTTISGVGGTSVDVAGSSEMTLVFDGIPVIHEVIIVGIAMDAILGQDILLSHQCKLDLCNLTLRLKGQTLSCWTPGETALACRVLIKEEVVIPSWSERVIEVDIANSGYLAMNGLVQPSPEVIADKEVLMMPGVISTRSPTVNVRVINFGESEVTLHPKQSIGSCESYYELPQSHSETKAAELRIIHKVSSELTKTLEDMVNKASPEMTASEKEQWKDLVWRFRGIFATSKADLGKTRLVRHKINTGNAVPIRIPARRLPLGKRKTEHEEVKSMLERGVIQPSTSPWASPIVLVTKKDGTTRFCVDYRALNEVSIKDAYPLPRIDDSLDALNGGRYFNTMHLMSGFWQIEMAPEDQEKTAFSTSLGLYEFKVMPFGLVNAPATFERLMETVLRGLQWEECLIYMDDIIVAGNSISQCLECLEHVFQRLMEAGLKLKPTKCSFFQKMVQFLGHLVSENGIETDPEKIAVVRNWPVPVTTKQVRSFLGLCSYYRRFINKFADIARPLHKLTEKTTIFEWTVSCQQAFDLLKQMLTSAPILSYPQQQGQLILDTDASQEAVGAVLSQVQDNLERVLGYFSKSLSKTERDYCVTRKELLAVVMALKHFHPYLYGRKVILRTDNSAVSWMRSLKAPSGQTARWLERVAEYNLEVTHRAGKSHGNADALSRLPCSSCKHQQCLNQEVIREEGDNMGVEDMQIRVTTRQQAGQCAPTDESFFPNQGWLQGWEVEKIRQSQLEDSVIGPFLLDKEDGLSKPAWADISERCADYKALWSQWDRLEVRGSLLFRKCEGGKTNSPRWQLLVPKGRWKEVFKHLHDHRTGGHLGVAKTLEKIQMAFYWPRMHSVVENFCRMCDSCAARKPTLQHQRAPLKQYIVGCPLERVAIDILGPLPKTKRGNTYVIVVGDYFTKWTEAFAIPDQEAATVARVLVEEFICRFGVPRQLHSDKDSNFESQLFQQTCKLLEIDKTRTSSRRPQSDGMVERFNRTLESMLSMYVEKKPSTWDEHLPYVMLAYRSSIHGSTGFSPNMMMLGREVELPLQAVVPRPEDDKEDICEYVQGVQEKLEEAHVAARVHLKKAAQHQKRNYDHRATNVRKFNPGQAVWYHNLTLKMGRCKKFNHPWKGPYTVTQAIDDVTYKIQEKPQSKGIVCHVDKLKLYKGEKQPMWFRQMTHE